MKAAPDRHGFTLVELMIAVVIIGVLATIALPHFQSVRNHAKAASTKTNCHTVQLAVEQYAAANGGTYPDATNDALPTTGETLIDMLPGGERLNNPYTDVRSEPVDGVPDQPGQVGYRSVVRHGVAVGYVLEAHDENEIVLTVSNGI